MKLSISIPTYNRKDQLIDTLECLVDQCRIHNVSIQINDNASSYPIKEVVNEHFQKYNDLIFISQNSANIGGDANFCRCFEIAEAEWFWLLGDDDHPAPDAVEKILDEINEAPVDCGYICFSTNKKEFQHKHVLAANDDFWYFVWKYDSFTNMSFISSGVYRNSKAKKYLIQAYKAVYTCFSHLVMMRCMHLDGGCLVLSSRKICQWQMPDEQNHWNRVPVIFGISCLTEIHGFGYSSRKSISQLFATCRPRPMSAWAIKNSIQCREADIYFWLRLFRGLLCIVNGKHFLSCATGLLICYIKLYCYKFKSLVNY
jgi:glycosyltransferase involved in cell wall biosynthesis